MECRIKMRSGRERVPRLAGGGASVPADSFGMECQRLRGTELLGTVGALIGCLCRDS